MSKKEAATLNMSSIFIIVAYSMWLFIYVRLSNGFASLQSMFDNIDKFWMHRFATWVQEFRMLNGGSSATKPTSEEAPPSQSKQNTNTNTTQSAKRGRSWAHPNELPTAKKSTPTTTVHNTFKSEPLRNVYVVFRAFRYGEELMGYAVWNSYPWRTAIDEYYGFPANAYIRFADLHEAGPFTPLIEQEGDTYQATNDPNPTNKHSLAHLLMFSTAEKNQWHLVNQLSGFHFVTKRGLDQVPLEKWLNYNTGGFNQRTPEELHEELDQSFQGCQHYLRLQCHSVQGTHMGHPCRYILIRQRRQIPDGCLDLFDRLLNKARANVSRRVDDTDTAIPVQAETGDI